ncbi:hypothetical protein QCA50_019384 [Cerrena zonata]|uniref:Cytochrome P450 n=1 Tax=Cerrena zonata TaxID=2478898 RepID=A0AAW0F9M0_9APHY
MALSIALWAFVVLALVWRLSRIGSRERSLPPGPPTLPLLGNLHQFPTEYTRIQFSSWAKQYGNIFSLKIAHGTAIIITSPKIIRDYMDRHGVSTAGRPSFTPVNIVSGGLNVAFRNPDQPWKQLRKAIQMFLSKEACAKHLPIQKAEAIQLVYDVLKRPQDISAHIHRQAVSAILSTVYGTRSPRFENSLASEFTTFEHGQEVLFEPGAIPPIDFIPLLKYVPARWAPWKQKCLALRAQYQKIFFQLRDMCESRIRMNKRNGCFLEDVMDQQQKLGLTPELAAAVGANCLEAGSLTITAFMQTFVFCLVHHPQVQREAQKEIDELVGTDRLPNLDDFERLPYVQAVVNETNRFFPPVPLGAPHMSTADEMVEGYLVPKGSTIFMNYYGIYRDPDLFDEPELFNPSRFLSSEFGTKPGADDTGFRHDLHFGSGRRICPGIYFANTSIKMSVLNLLWAFNFESTENRQRDPQCPIRFDDFAPGLATGPKPFSCTLNVRSEQHANLIRAEYASARSTFEIFEHELSREEADFVANW